MRDDFQTGATLGRYEILRKLAVGGMAQIYLARVRGTAGFEKLVVLKRISPAVAEDRDFVKMFLDEARLAATLRHPNIADVFDVGEEAGSYYFAMEFIHGQDARAVRLAAQEVSGTVPLEVAIAIVSGTAYALAYAHAKTGPKGPLGIVHRDISPSNILVSYDGAVKLVDFGIARAHDRTTQTRTGTLKGKVPYMSPEQCRGLPLDRRCDIFSLGTVLYELTCGQRPFDGRSEYDTLEMIAMNRLQPPHTHLPDYPPALEAIVMRMLAHDRGARYQSADDVLSDLERFTSEAGLLMSERVVAKYMRELFAEEIAAWDTTAAAPAEPRPPSKPSRPRPPTTLGEDPPTKPDEPPLEPLLVTPDVQVFVRSKGSSTVPPPVDPRHALGTAPTRPMDAVVPPTRTMATAPTRPMDAVAPPRPTPAQSPTPARPTHWPRVPMPDRNKPPGKRPRASTFQDEASTVRPDFTDEGPTEQTSRSSAARHLAAVTRKPKVTDTARDDDPPFDPIVARADDILDDVDRDAPPGERPEARALRRINELAARITAWLAIGELELAVVAAELAYEEEDAGARAQHALDAEQPTLEAAFAAYLGDQRRRVSLTRSFDELFALDLDPTPQYLLSRIGGGHGHLTLRDLLDDPALGQLDIARWLCRLLLRKMIIVA